MPKNNSKSTFEKFPLLSSLRVLCVFLFFSVFFVLAGEYSVPTQEFFVVVAILGAMGFGVLSLILRDKGKTKAQLAKRKQIWDVAFNGRQPETSFVTYGLLGVLALIFLLEGILFFTWSQGPFDSVGSRILITLGACSRVMVLEKGEWYRLFTAVLLHAGPMHLLSNALGLYIAGKILESLAGPSWLGATFALSGLGGTLMSMAVNPPGGFTVGASGAIMGLMGANYVLSFRLKEGNDRKRLQGYLVQILIFNIVPIIWSHSGHGVDYGGHLGGALAGMLLGLLLFAIWEGQAPSAAWNNFGKVLAFSGLGAYVLAIGFLIEGYVRSPY